MLHLEGVQAAYGTIRALKGVSLSVNQGEITTVIGANGAGKSTTLRVITGLTTPLSGSVTFEGQPIGGMLPEQIARLGIAMVPEGRRLFPDMSVFENLLMGAYARNDPAAIQRGLDRSYALFPVLAERRNQLASTLSGGEQQMAAIGRALMAEPRLLLLDEPSLGLAPMLVRSVFRLIQEINRQGTTILLVEQNSNMALRIASRGYVMESGQTMFDDSAEALLKSDLVKASYLGH
jgi:branched-chain amino acid transport system ATP-binding protein